MLANSIRIVHPSSSVAGAPRLYRKSIFHPTVAPRDGDFVPAPTTLTRGHAVESLISDFSLENGSQVRVTVSGSGASAVVSGGVNAEGKCVGGSAIPYLVHLDLSGIAQKGFVAPAMRLDTRGISDFYSVNRGLRERLEGVGSVNRAAATRFSNLVVSYRDPEGTDMTPIFERLWAGFICAATGAQIPANTVQSRFDDLFPDQGLPLEAAFAALEASENGLNRILVPHRDPMSGMPDGAWTVLANFHRSMMGFTQNMLGNVPHSHARPYRACPAMLIVGLINRPTGVPVIPVAAAGDAAAIAHMMDPGNWLQAIAYLLLQVHEANAMYCGFYDCMERNVFFMSPIATQLASPPGDRVVGWAQVEDTYWMRLLCMRTRERAFDGAISHALVAAGESVANSAVGGIWDTAGLMPRPFVGRGTDEAHYEQWNEFDFSAPNARGEFHRQLCLFETSRLMSIQAYTCGDGGGFRGSFVPARSTIAAGAFECAPPAGFSSAQFREALAGWRSVSRGSSLNVVNLVRRGTAAYPSGLNYIYDGLLTIGTSTAGKQAVGNHLGRIRTLGTARVLANYFALAVVNRAAADAAAAGLGICLHHIEGAAGDLSTGTAILDNVINESDITGLVTDARTLEEGYFAALDSGTAALGTCGNVSARNIAQPQAFRLQQPAGMTDYRFVRLQALHPVLQQAILPEQSVAGYVPKPATYSQMFSGRRDPVYGSIYEEDLLTWEFVSALRVLGYAQGSTPCIRADVVIEGLERRIRHQTTDIWPAIYNEHGGVRNSDTFPGMPSFASDVLSYFHSNIPFHAVLTDTYVPVMGGNVWTPVVPPLPTISPALALCNHDGFKPRDWVLGFARGYATLAPAGATARSCVPPGAEEGHAYYHGGATKANTLHRLAGSMPAVPAAGTPTMEVVGGNAVGRYTRGQVFLDLVTPILPFTRYSPTLRGSLDSLTAILTYNTSIGAINKSLASAIRSVLETAAKAAPGKLPDTPGAGGGTGKPGTPPAPGGGNADDVARALAAAALKSHPIPPVIQSMTTPTLEESTLVGASAIPTGGTLADTVAGTALAQTAGQAAMAAREAGKGV